MLRIKAGLLISTFALILLSGCSVPKLGPPDTTGLLVVEARVFTVGVGGGLRLSSTFPSFAEIESADGSTIKGKFYINGIFIFGSLAPGVYKLVRVSETDPRFTISVGGATDKLPENKAYSVNIEPGKPIYIGVVQLKNVGVGRVTGTVSTKLEPSVEDEKAAWKKLMKAYAGTPWEARIKKRLDQM